MSLAMLHIESHFLIILILIDHYNCARLHTYYLNSGRIRRKNTGWKKALIEPKYGNRIHQVEAVST